ncbi:ACSL [Lepeophtheirus salmonis]|uniref:long-chain-fatty-acid--CoA ligase n=1 Tax=Lepeophtheirus salmonis TaxID=72036 RepID=A0A7R8CM60_LEPSM|nr:ACSL [Lepeophtheirus salmonis]CAF2829009.1 ACSL [Lepeophtheirus salmonis]
MTVRLSSHEREIVKFSVELDLNSIKFLNKSLLNNIIYFLASSKGHYNPTVCASQNKNFVIHKFMMRNYDVKNLNLKNVTSFLSVGLIKLIVLTWDLLVSPIYYLIYQPWKKGNQKLSTIQTLLQNDSTIVYRSLDNNFNEDRRKIEYGDTLVDLIDYASKANMSKNCFGTRRIFNVEQIVTKENNTMTKYDQGLRHLKFLPKDKILLYAESSAKWLVSAFGCFKNSMTVVTIYTNLGDEGVYHCIEQTDAKVIITSQNLLKRLQKILASKGGLIQTIIYLEKEEFSLAQTTPEQDVNVYSFNEILEKGLKSYSQNDNEEDWRPNSEDIAVIMYTSGSSGVPKGVVLSHFNIMSNIFAHIFELSVEIALFGKGIPIGFSGPNTLMNSGSMVKEGQIGDICELKPTYMAVVPLIADRIYKIIIQKVSENGPFSELLFNFCYEYKSKWRKLGMNTPIINLLFFKKIQQFLGGNVSTIVSGGAPLSAQAHEFMEIVFDLKLSQGYGLTETCGGFILGRKEDFSLGEVGHPFPGPFVKLTNWDEGEYTVKDKPYPRGEIHVGGGLIAMGYFELMDETEENFYEENGVRWFKTGDIGQLQSSGALKIIDRKKDIIKLQNGEYVFFGKGGNIPRHTSFG